MTPAEFSTDKHIPVRSGSKQLVPPQEESIHYPFSIMKHTPKQAKNPYTKNYKLSLTKNGEDPGQVL